MSDEYAVRDAWDAFGGGYDPAFSSSFTAIARAALRFADVQPGMRLLDVAAGSGALSPDPPMRSRIGVPRRGATCRMGVR